MLWNQNFRVHLSDGAKEIFNGVSGALLLALSFWLPIQPVLPINTYRLTEVAILVMGAATFAVHGAAVRVPFLVGASFWIGLAAWIVSTVFSSDFKRSIDVGTLDFLILYAVLYLVAVHLRHQRKLVIAAILLAAGAAIIAVVQTVTIVSLIQRRFEILSQPLSYPMLASEFLRYKGAIPQAFPAGVPNGYGNIDNYASLCALLLPWLLGLLYVSRQRWLILALFLIHGYACLVVYSRGLVLAFGAAVCVLWLFRFRVYGRLSPAICAALVGAVLLHADYKVVSSFAGAVTSFVSAVVGRSAVLEAPSSAQIGELERSEKSGKTDQSPVDRARALSTGVSIGFKSSMLGVGYGVYPTVDTALTSPHSLAVLRFAEAGILGLIGFVLLAIYAPCRLAQVLRRREKNMLEATCLCAVSAFLAKAAIFGANFSVSSNFVWGFGVAVCLGASLIARENHTGRLSTDGLQLN